MPSRLTDGLPITTEWLNSLVDAINDLSPTDSVSSTIRAVAYTGRSLGTTSSLQIEAGEHTGTATSAATAYESTISFTTPFKSGTYPVVIPVTVFTNNGSRKNRPYKASCSVGLVTNSKFECTVDLQDGDIGGSSVVINYLAIGQRA